MTPPQTVPIAADAGAIAPGADQTDLLSRLVLDELYELAGAAAYDLPRGDFEAIVGDLGREQNYGCAVGETPRPEQCAAWLRGLRLNEIVLARACARGKEEAWRYFLAQYRQPILRAATAVTRSESLGADLAENLYAELYGLNLRDGERRSPLASYKGRGSLMGWLRTILAQRHVDHYRRTGREQSLDRGRGDDEMETLEPAAPEPAPAAEASTLSRLSSGVEAALKVCDAEERFLLASYYLDQRTLLEISKLLHVHEATISRRVHRVTERLRKELLRQLQAEGLSRRAAEEALGTDPRDMEVNLRGLLQPSLPQTFSDEEGA